MYINLKPFVIFKKWQCSYQQNNSHCVWNVWTLTCWIAQTHSFSKAIDPEYAQILLLLWERCNLVDIIPWILSVECFLSFSTIYISIFYTHNLHDSSLGFTVHMNNKYTSTLKKLFLHAQFYTCHFTFCLATFFI